MDANQERKEANRKAYHEEMMAMLDAYHERMMACLGKTEADTEKTEPDPGMMQSTEEDQEIPKGEAAAMLVGEPRKRCRVRNMAVERRQKRKERTRGNRGSRRKLAAACRKVSRPAKVAWRKRKLVRRSGTQENCGPLCPSSVKIELLRLIGARVSGAEVCAVDQACQTQLVQRATSAL
jgi:hypothetical protein